MKEKIAIIGLGYVGSKVYDFFKMHGFCVYSFDLDDSKSDVKKIEDFNAYDLDFAFICVPTPMSQDGSCDVSSVNDAVKRIRAKTIVVQSTVPPGTLRRLESETGKDILFVPEYFGETNNHLFNDLNERSFFVIGGREEVRKRLVALYNKIFDSMNMRYGFFDSTTAEMVKYISNAYLATKVMFCEEFFRICEAFGVSYNEVREGWLLDPRVNPSHTFVRKDDLPGFGGKCLPKDVSAIISASKDAGYDPEFLRAVLEYTKKAREGK